MITIWEKQKPSEGPLIPWSSNLTLFAGAASECHSQENGSGTALRPHLKSASSIVPNFPTVLKGPLADPPAFGRIISTMPELPSQRHVNCFDGDFEPKAGDNVNALWIDPTVAYGAMPVRNDERQMELCVMLCKFQQFIVCYVLLSFKSHRDFDCVNLTSNFWIQNRSWEFIWMTLHCREAWI